MSAEYSTPALAAELDVIARMAKDLDRRLNLLFQHAPDDIKARLSAVPQLNFEGLALHQAAAALADELEMG